MNKKLLNRMLNHAYNTVPYYKNLFEKNSVIKNGKEMDFKAIPLLKKDIIRDNESFFISNTYKTKYIAGQLALKKTSGSTGNYLSIYWSQNDDTITDLVEWRSRCKWYGVSVKDKYLSFHTSLYSGGNLIKERLLVFENSINMSINKTLLNKDNIHYCIEKIRDFSPVWMLTQPSVLYIMLTNMNEDEIRVLNILKYIELTGEYVHNGIIKFFKKCLPSVMFSNMYGTTETGCIALECPFGHKHILDNAFVEIINNIPNNPEYGGNIILTSLRNMAMPLIKYSIGDRGTIKESKCDCGYQGYDIEVNMGRESDILELPNGDKRLSSALLIPIEIINSEYNDAIVQFHFIQEKVDLLRICICLKKEYISWGKTIETSIVDAMKKHISNIVDYSVDYNCDEFFNNKNKLKIFTKKF